MMAIVMKIEMEMEIEIETEMELEMVEKDHAQVLSHNETFFKVQQGTMQILNSITDLNDTFRGVGNEVNQFTTAIHASIIHISKIITQSNAVVNLFNP